jgi:hypothetical protein
MRKISLLFFVTALVIFSSACSTTESGKDCICTEEFRIEYVFITDAQGLPIDDLTTVMINETSGDTLENNGAFVYEPGMYWLIDDNYLSRLTEYPQTFTFKAENDSVSVGAVYQFATDNCKCHVQKLSGPDTLRVN